MRWPLREEELPRGYLLEESRAGVLVVEQEAAGALRSGGLGPEGGERLSPSEFSGRRPMQVIRARGSHAESVRYLVRSFHHGGLFRWLGPFLYLDPRRPFQELSLAAALESLGIPTPRVAAARARRCLWGLGGWRLDLVTRAVEGCMDGGAALEMLRRGALGFGRRRRLFAAAGALVGKLHRVGFLHKDLHARNMLFGEALEEGEGAWILDLDGSSLLTEGLGEGQRQHNLARAWRWLRRQELRFGRFTSWSDALVFLKAYLRALGQEADWKAEWRAIARKDRRATYLHRASWWLEGRFGLGHARHDGRQRDVLDEREAPGH